jgi:phosphatidylinositol alpha 1,6-mannosyltransferase
LIRVAYFPDSFHEVNGVAHTSRHFEAFARRGGLPFLCVRAGQRPTPQLVDGAVTTLELPRASLSIPLDKDLRLDPSWIRHLPVIVRVLRAFRPDILHITGPSEVGITGAALALLLGIPLAASWHTNLHEYAARRSHWFFDHLSARTAATGKRAVEAVALSIATILYRRAQVLFAPNPELCRLLEQKTHRPCHLMRRGVDAELFSPAHRLRPARHREFLLGYAGRLSVEKNVAMLAQIQADLERRGLRNFRFRIVGQGTEESWLREHLPRAEFCGVLRGEALARAYADMDAFVFPSHTDTFGNVVLEAMASGVPAVVTPDGGPKSLVCSGVTGFVAEDAGFAEALAALMNQPALHAEMRCAAREHARAASWDAVFGSVYAAYRPLLGASSIRDSA